MLTSRTGRGRTLPKPDLVLDVDLGQKLPKSTLVVRKIEEKKNENWNLNVSVCTNSFLNPKKNSISTLEKDNFSFSLRH